MVTQSEAIKAANAAIKAGDAIQHVMINGQLHVQSDQGWQVWWPYDPEPDNNPDCNH